MLHERCLPSVLRLYSRRPVRVAWQTTRSVTDRRESCLSPGGCTAQPQQVDLRLLSACGNAVWFRMVSVARRLLHVVGMQLLIWALQTAWLLLAITTAMCAINTRWPLSRPFRILSCQRCCATLPTAGPVPHRTV